jgi:hypothetical protein
MKQMQHSFSLVMVATIISATGCSTVRPTPDASAAAEARPWAAPTPQTPDEQYPWASFIADLLGWAVK